MTPTGTNPAAATLKFVKLDEVHESPRNPRHRYRGIEELAESLKTHGQLTPALVRTNANGYELAAGHRRFRAAKLAGLTHLEVKVRQIADAEFAEILTIENSERSDLHPLEEAEGYKLLMEEAGYDVAKIATRINRSHEFVHDRMRLLQLIPELKAQFLESRFLLAHAIILAKLTPEHQRAAMRTERVGGYGSRRREGGLYRTDLTLDRKVFPYVPASPGELQEWVNDNCRFKPDAVQLEEDFPETAVLLESAQETGTKVVYITDGFMVSSGARDVNEKTIPERSWKRADGEYGSKTCDRAVVGIYADGDTRGEAIGVCISKTSCLVHWGPEVRARKAREAKKAKGGAGASTKTKKAPALRAYTPQQIKAKRTVSIRGAAVKPLEQALKIAHIKPNVKLVAAARAWAMKEADVKGTLSADELLVALFAVDAYHTVYWKLRERPQELAVFGVDAILAQIKVDTCVHCGCSEENACRIEKPGSYSSRSCKWISKTPLVCDNPVCVAQFEKAGGKAPASVKQAVASSEADLGEAQLAEAQLAEEDLDDEA
jgi:ParB/RepB/Spo0J family partition protein